jgi:hypothetical protein
MKHSKLFRILTVGVLLGLLVMLFPAAPAMAAEDIDIYDSDDDRIDEAEIGDKIYIEGDGFYESIDPDYYYVDIYFSGDEADEGDDIDDEVENYERMKSSVDTDENGDFSTSFTIPDELTDGDDDVEVTGGDYYIYVTYDDGKNIEAVADIKIIAGEIELDVDEGPVGIEVEITGTDFGDEEDLEVEFDGDDIDIEAGDTETDDDGEFTLTIVIPEATGGDHTIKVTDDGGSSAEAEFTIEAGITLSDSSAAPGDSITVYGTGFGDEVDVVIEFDGDEVAEEESDSDGSFQIIFTVPVLSAGSYDIEVTDDDDNEAETNFTIAAGISTNKTSGNVGDTVTITGKGFTPNATITITLATEKVTATADSNGQFSASITIPAIQSGSQTITITDGVNTKKATFDLESTPPSRPNTSVPLDGEKAESPTVFDWADVTDPSEPVTYNLQVATDQSFTQIVLRKTNLTVSEYTLTEEEKLASTGQDAPYYWRVQAVDGANNPSDWSTASSFTVGFSFSSLGWWVYVLAGIAVLLIVLIVYLLALRRRAF